MLKRLSVLVILLALPALAVTVFRVDPSPAMTVSGSGPSTGYPQLFAVPGAQVSLCSDQFCATTATSYQDSTGAVACPTFSPVTLPGALPAKCSAYTGPQGQFGFWLPTGLYYYKISLPSGVSYGPFPVSSNGSSSVFPAGGLQTQYLQVSPNTGSSTTYRFSSLPSLNILDYNFPAQSCSASNVCSDSGSSGASLIAGNNVLTMNPVPLGLNGTDTNHTIYVNGGSFPQTCLITGGTGTSGQQSGQIIVNCGHTATGAFTIVPAWNGAQEAVNVACAAGGGTINGGSAAFSIYATLTIPCSNITLSFNTSGNGPAITRTGDFGDSIYVAGPVTNVHISGLNLTQTINYDAGPPPTIVNRPTSGAHVHFYICWSCSISDSQLDNMVYGIDADGVGNFWAERNTIHGLWDYANAGAQVTIAGIFLHHPTVSSYGYPTYAYIQENAIRGYASASRTIAINGNNITKTELVGPKYGIWVASCEDCFIKNNSIETCDYSGIHVASLASPAGPFLDTLIDGNFIDFNRQYGIDFDMSANPEGAFALDFRITHNRIGSSGGLLNGIFFAGPVTPGVYVRTAAGTIIANNFIFGSAGAGILLNSSNNTNITGNAILDYNFYNAYPTNSLTCGPNSCTGDRIGSSAIFLQGPAHKIMVTNNMLGGSYAGGSYDGAFVWTRTGVGVGVNSAFGPPNSVTAPNFDTGTQPVASRSPAVSFDAAFLTFPSILSNGNVALTHLTSGSCGTLDARATLLGGLITSGTDGTCGGALNIDPAAWPGGMTCSIQNLTHPGATNAMYQTVSATDGFTFTGTTVSGDVLAYSCAGY